MEEARPFHTLAEPTEAIDVVETCYLSQDKLPESVVQETASPVHDPTPMEVDPEVGTKSSGQRTGLSGLTWWWAGTLQCLGLPP